MEIKQTNPSSNNKSKGKVCPYCGQSSQTVFGHGHEQCLVCETNVDPCCQGQALIRRYDIESLHYFFSFFNCHKCPSHYFFYSSTAPLTDI